ILRRSATDSARSFAVAGAAEHRVAGPAVRPHFGAARRETETQRSDSRNSPQLGTLMKSLGAKSTTEKRGQRHMSLIGERFSRNNFALIRLILATAVLYVHSFALTDTVDPLSAIIPKSTHLGAIALYLFLVVSGFLVTYSWERSSGWFDF